jgi:tRNA 2-thiouridine synthesizing protein A
MQGRFRVRRHRVPGPSVLEHRVLRNRVLGQGGRSMVPPTRPAPALTIDALGRKCPIPIIMLAERIREVPIGETIAVLADDPAARPDIPAWCVMKSQEFVVEIALTRGWAFLIKRTY